MLNDGFGDLWDGEIDLDDLLKNEEESDVPFSNAPLGNMKPEVEFLELMAEVNRARIRFQKTRSLPPFAVVLSAIDKMGLQWLAHESGEADICEWAEGDELEFDGLLVEAARFIEQGRYVVICQEDYDNIAVEGLFL